ncbi:GNAT family N-acetyltransferase [Vibrio azureus]|uniref:ElaA protein n=1 Tax=Vibrio azureus NBRC 104587 TaxID=1219077 RepID=U3C8H5_9VIBR|nr:GNAT family N-acetyltransferase [Vibrio azureus]AUI87784.1 GNAT family N-acetyltransferase [Vibrio azureus]GAD74738.1 ElaA protein [Vibrio azureus NBRC 104587]
MLYWKVSNFSTLTVFQLYDLLKLRVDVFIKEQNCPYNDLDDKDTDPNTLHILGYHGDKLVAYSRILPPGLGYPHEVHDQIPADANDIAIGRVVTSPACRGQGLGHQLMAFSVKTAKETWPGKSIFISSQAHLVQYYGQYGFEAATLPYEEDGLPMMGLKCSPMME